LITWGVRILTLHLNYVAGYTDPLLFLFERIYNYYDRKSDCLKSTETGVGVSARINDSNSLGDRARDHPGSERRLTGTVEEISACIHVTNSHGDRTKGNHRQSANSLWERDDSCMSMGASNVSQWRSGGSTEVGS